MNSENVNKTFNESFKYDSTSVTRESEAYQTTLFKHVNYGWICPICQRVYAPHIPCCFYCGQNSNRDVWTCQGSAIESEMT